MAKPAPSRVAAALDYLERLKNQATEFGGGVVENLADRARSVGGLAYEALATDPNMGRMTTAEYAQAASRPTPRLDQAAQDLGTIGRAIVTQPIQTGKAIVQGEIDRAQEATTSPRAAGKYAGSFIDPMRIAAALRKTAPVLELDVYHGTPHRFPGTEANPLGEFDASKIGTGEGAQAYGHGVYLAESPGVAEMYQKTVKNSAIANKPDTPEFLAEYAIKRWQSPEKALKNLEIERNNFKTPLNDTERKQYDEALELLRRGEVTQGYRYKADLSDEMIDRMLDYDKPLSEQSKSVQAILKELAKKDAQKYGAGGGLDYYMGDPDSYSGESVYRYLAEQQDGQVATSKYFKDLGIPGIRYLDAGSRGQGGRGTRNFVVFPGEEKKVRILERK